MQRGEVGLSLSRAKECERLGGTQEQAIASWCAPAVGTPNWRITRTGISGMVSARSSIRWCAPFVYAISLAIYIQAPLGCGSGRATAPQPTANERINRLKNLYFLYVEKNRKGPPDEAALREFGQKLSETERADRGIGNDLEGIFTSPRDNKKFVVHYNIRIDPSQDRAIAWEDTGVGGKRVVALSQGYIVEYDDETLRGFKK